MAVTPPATTAAPARNVKKRLRFMAPIRGERGDGLGGAIDNPARRWCICGEADASLPPAPQGKVNARRIPALIPSDITRMDQQGGP